VDGIEVSVGPLNFAFFCPFAVFEASSLSGILRAFGLVFAIFELPV
jgi:hypothetical protein